MYGTITGLKSKHDTIILQYNKSSLLYLEAWGLAWGLVTIDFLIIINHKTTVSTVNKSPFSLLYKDASTASWDD